MKPANKKRVPPITTLVEDVGDLRAFGLVVDLQSVTSAASVLGESKATTSRRLTRLEKSLGVPLLKRTSRNVSVTEQGRAYRQRIGEVLEMLAHANANVRSVHQEPQGDLRVGAPPSLTRFLAPLTTTYVEQQPQVHVDLVISDHPLDLDMEEIDTAFGLHADRGGDDELEEALLPVRLICVAAPRLVSRNAPVTPSDLAKHRIVSHVAAEDRELAFVETSTGKSAPVKLHSAISASSIELVAELALHGAGIAIVPHVAVAGDLASGRLVRVLPHHSIRWGALYVRHRRSRNLPAKLSSFRDFVKEYVRVFPVP